MVTVNRPTALGLSAVLHAALLCAGLIAWPWVRHNPPIHVTPITLMKAADIQPLRAAEQAPEPQEAKVETPEPAAPPEPPPPPKPAPKPVPTPPTPAPAPPKVAPAAKPVAKAPPAPAKSAATTGANTKPVNLDDLARSLAQTTPRPPAPVSGAARGPTQAERDIAQRQADGQARAATANALQAIGAKIADNWNVSCSSADDRNVSVTLRLELSRDGSLLGAKPENYPSVDLIPDPRIRAAAISAVSAARAASPFAGLPEQTYGDWRSKTYEFRASDVCADRLRKR